MTPSALQEVPRDSRATAAAQAVAAAVLRPETAIDSAIELVAQHLVSLPRVDVVVVALTSFPPDDPTRWTALGGRAWLREWLAEGSTCSIVPPPGAGPEAALSLPWLSQRARHEVVALPDVELLPSEAAQDRRELTGCGVRAIVGGSQLADGIMLGSVSVGSAVAGPWLETDIADFQLLDAALTSRMSLEVTRRSLTDALQVADDARSRQQQFFAAIGHELRTPIAAIMAYSEVLRDEADELGEAGAPGTGHQPVTEPAERLRQFGSMVGEDSRVVLRAAEQLLAVVEDLLDTGRLLGDKEAQVDVEVADAVRDVLHWHRVSAQPAGIELSSTVEPGLAVRSRPSAFRQALTNLVGNAIVHNVPGGKVDIAATRHRGENGEPRVRVTVHDTGPGLDAEQLNSIFEPFVRFAAPGIEGTGLGLPLTRTLVERDGGTVGATSTVGRGTTFWIDLPAPS